MKAEAKRRLGLATLVASARAFNTPAVAQPQKPNVLVIMADDVGYWNISA